MSRTALRQVPVPSGVELNIAPSSLTVKGQHGSLGMDLRPSSVKIELDDNVVNISHDSAIREDRAMAGTVQALVRNMIVGVTEQWEKRLEIRGVGYRAQVNGKKLTLQVGYSHPVEYEVPADIEVLIPTPTEVVIKGADRQKVGQVAAEIRGFRPPEPYKGKGIRYLNEYVRSKEGKKS